MPDIKHESAAINSRPILWAGGSLFTAVVVVGFCLTGLLDYFARREASRTLTNVNPLAVRRNAHSTDERLAAIVPPRLDGLQELQDGAPPFHPSLPARAGNPPEYHPEDLRPAEWPQLSDYAWVDKDKGIARIPIEQAMTALLKMNRLPTQPGAENARPLRK